MDYFLNHLRERHKFKFDKEGLYMKKSISRIIGLTMLIIAIVFIMFALNHPEKSFPFRHYFCDSQWHHLYGLEGWNVESATDTERFYYKTD